MIYLAAFQVDPKHFYIPNVVFTKLPGRKIRQRDRNQDITEQDHAEDINLNTCSEDSCKLTSYSTIYECPKCSARYLRRKNFIDHMNSDVHMQFQERETLSDFAIKTYANAVNEVCPSAENELFSGYRNQLIEEGISEANLLHEGWALKQRKTSARFSQKQKDFLIKLFEEGQKTKIKYDGRKAKKRMEDEIRDDGLPLFDVDEYLEECQINSFFSRYASSNRKNSDMLQSVESEEQEEIEVVDVSEILYENLHDIINEITL